MTTLNLSVSEQKLLRKLHENEHFLEQVLNRIPDIIYILDLKRNRFTYTNERVKDIMGFENIMLDKIHPLDYATRLGHLVACSSLKEHEMRDITVRMRVKGGEWHWFHMRDYPFKFGDDGAVTHVIGLANDIQESKLNEEKLRRQDILLRKLLDVKSLGIVVHRAIRNAKGDILDYEFVLASKMFEKFHNRTDLAGKWAFEEFPETKRKVYDYWKRVVDTGEKLELETSSPDAVTGAINYFHIKYEKFDDGLIAVFENITEKKIAEEKIREQAEFIRRVTRITPDIIDVFDFESGRHVFVNREIYDMLGITAEYVQRTDSRILREQIIHPDDWEKTIHFVQALQEAADDQIIEDEYRMRHVSGKWLWFSRRGAVFQRKDGKVTQFLALSQEITKRKEAEEKLRNSKNLLESVISASPLRVVVAKSIRDEAGKIRDFEYVLVRDSSREMPAEDLAGKKISEMFKDSFLQTFDRFVHTVETGEAQSWEYLFPESEKPKWYQVTLVKLNDGFVCTGLDITQFKQMQETRSGK